MSNVQLEVSGNGEQYTYDAATDSMQGAGKWLELMNNMIELADFGDNPYKRIADFMMGLGYIVTYKYTPDSPEVVDGI